MGFSEQLGEDFARPQALRARIHHCEIVRLIRGPSLEQIENGQRRSQTKRSRPSHRTTSPGAPNARESPEAIHPTQRTPSASCGQGSGCRRRPNRRRRAQNRRMSSVGSLLLPPHRARDGLGPTRQIPRVRQPRQRHDARQPRLREEFRTPLRPAQRSGRTSRGRTWSSLRVARCTRAKAVTATASPANAQAKKQHEDESG